MNRSTYLALALVSCCFGSLVTGARGQTVGQADRINAFADTGTVMVLNDGSLVVFWGALDDQGRLRTDLAPVDTAFVVADGARLVHYDRTWSVLALDADSAPGGGPLDADIPLTGAPCGTGCDRYAVFAASGTVTLTPRSNATAATLTVDDAVSADTFRVEISMVPTTRGGSGRALSSCSVHCPPIGDGKLFPGGDCSVTNCDGIAACFCGFLHEPICFCIHRIFGLASGQLADVTAGRPLRR